MCDSEANSLHGGVGMSYLHDSFHWGVDFSTYFFASPQPVEETPYRINFFRFRLQFKMVAIVTWSPQEGFLQEKAVSKIPLNYFIASIVFPRIWSLFLPFWSTISTIISSCCPNSLAFLFKITTTYIYHHVHVVFTIQHSSLTHLLYLPGSYRHPSPYNLSFV